MRAVVQRVQRAVVTVAGEETGGIAAGLLVLLGAATGDALADVEYLADKIANLRIFEDAAGKMNLSILDTGGELCVVSQFTLLGDCRKGRRPSFSAALAPDQAQRLYEVFIARCRQTGLRVAVGRFAASMDVELINHGPVTMLLDSKKLF